MAKGAPLELDWAKILPGYDGSGGDACENTECDWVEELEVVNSNSDTDSGMREHTRNAKGFVDPSSLSTGISSHVEKVPRALRTWPGKVHAGTLAKFKKKDAVAYLHDMRRTTKSVFDSDRKSWRHPLTFLQSSKGPSTQDDDSLFGEELNIIKRNTCRISDNERISSSMPLSKVDSSLRLSRFSAEHQHKLHVGCDNPVEPLSSFGRHSSKRTKAPQISSIHDFQKVHEVIFLDDEDPVSTSQMNEVPDKWRRRKIYYPSRDDQNAVELTYQDLKCLDPREFLSSPVINFYIQYLKRSLPMKSALRKFYIFNTYFYNKLEEAFSGKDDHHSRFLKLRRWWKGVEIFQMSYLILPIHGKMHWSLVIISLPAKESKSGPVILHLDSLELHDSSAIFKILKSYLEEERRFVCGKPSSCFSMLDSIQENLLQAIRTETVAVPQQRNAFDCGLFILYFIELFLREAPESLGDDHKMFGRNWFDPEEASRLRQTIRQLLLNEFENPREESVVSSSESVDEIEDPDCEQSL